MFITLYEERGRNSALQIRLVRAKIELEYAQISSHSESKINSLSLIKVKRKREIVLV